MTDWKDAAACAGHEATMASEQPADIRTARSLCAACPVLTACAAYAEADPKIPGTIAGLTHQQRLETAGRRRCAGCGNLMKLRYYLTGDLEANDPAAQCTRCRSDAGATRPYNRRTTTNVA